jgi:hypothetical protein
MRAPARRLRRSTHLAAVRAGAALAGLVGLAAAAPAPAVAEPAAGIAGATTLVTFDTASPGAVTVRAINGLRSANETVVGIDLRPATGQLYAVTVPLGVLANALVRTYALDPATGAATFVGSIPSTVPGAADTQWGVDFNPTVDRLRAVLANGESFRINPSNGSLAGNDPDLTFSAGATGPVVGAAYDRNTVQPAGSPVTLYEIDRGANQLVVQGGIDGRGPGGANGGQVTAVGPLGVTLDAGSDAGFDVSGATGVAFATLRSGGVTGLYTVDLATGAATLVGSLPLDVRDVAILPPPAVPPPAPPPSPGPTPSPPSDSTAPKSLLDLAARATFGRLLRSKLALGFSCNEACTASARLAAGRTTLATATGSLPSATTGTLRLRPTRAGRRYLSARAHPRRRRARARLTMTVTDAAGNRSALARKLLLTR